MLRTATYIRVSTDKQAREGDSVAAQRDALNKYIADHANLIHAGEYLDDGISGTKFDRDAFQALLEDVKAGKVDLILITKMDRLHRSLRNFLNMQDTLDKHNCNWMAIWEPMYDSSTPQGRLIINQLMSIAQFEAENTGQRIRQVMAYKIQQGEVTSGRPPLGYKVENKHLVFSDDAPLIRSVFEFYARTGSMYQTGRLMANLGFPREQYAIRLMLKNKRYIGEHRGNTNYCQPLVDRETFEQVQRNLSRNVKKSQTHTYIFSGLLTCPECGKKFTGLSLHGTIPMYRCTGHYNPKRVCGNTKTIRESVLEKKMLPFVRPYVEEYVKSAKETEKRQADNKRQVANLQKKIDKLKELYVNELIGLEEYKADKEKYLTEIAELESAQETVAVRAEGMEPFLRGDFEENYMSWSSEQKRFFWRSITKAIYFGQDRVVRPVFL